MTNLISTTQLNRRPKTDWHFEDVKAAVRKRGGTLTALSRENGYAASAAGIALRRSWPALERIVADFLGLEPWAIWPTRYTADQKPKCRRWQRRS
jgi:Ner family transcriptional regulator